jgi:hypothetical protein
LVAICESWRAKTQSCDSSRHQGATAHFHRCHCILPFGSRSPDDTVNVDKHGNLTQTCHPLK